MKGKRQENAELLRNSPPNSTGQCGLVNGKDNLTNICFQNSLLQSLYMAPAFRRKLLDISRQPLDENGSTTWMGSDKILALKNENLEVVLVSTLR